jgi:hypothetical protein
VLDAEIQRNFQKQRCLPCWLLREVFDHVRSKYLDPLNNYASTEQKTANYIDVDFQTPCVPWQRSYWDTNLAMCIIKTKQQHMCTIQRYMAISLYWDKGNGHLHHRWHMCSIQRYKDIFENRNLYQTLECPRRRSTKLQNITHVLGYILEPSREILKLPLPPLDVWVHQVCAGMPITSQNSWEPKSVKTGTCSLGYFNSCVALDSSNWLLVCSFSIWINASQCEITPPSSSSWILLDHGSFAEGWGWHSPIQYKVRETCLEFQHSNNFGTLYLSGMWLDQKDTCTKEIGLSPNSIPHLGSGNEFCVTDSKAPPTSFLRKGSHDRIRVGYCDHPQSFGKLTL